MKKTPIEISKELQDEANKLINEEDLLELFLQYGYVCFTGSYELELMIWPRIEVYLLLDNNPYDIDAFIDIGDAIAKTYDTLEMQFQNHLESPDEGDAQQMHWSIKIARENQSNPWQLDIYAMNVDNFEDQMERDDELKKKINKENRELILKTKHSLLTKKGIPPFEIENAIHKAVLSEKILNKNKLVQYLKKEGINLK